MAIETVYIATLESISPLSCSRYHNTPKLEKESHDDAEKRTWREKARYNAEGFAIIDPMQFKFSIAAAPKFSGEKITGRGNATWTKHFEAGLMIVDPIVTTYTRETIGETWVYVNADGRRGGGTRVMRCFPTIHEWKGKLPIHVLDPTITEEILKKYIIEAGSFIGIGQFRPQVGGTNGRFALKKIQRA